MKIPVQNIYYLLCYAWDKLEEGKKIPVSADDYSDSLHLLARVLVNGCRQLFKRGLDKSYVAVTEEYIGIKGKIDFNVSLQKQLFRQGRAVCRFDEFTADILPNQLLKATLLRLLRIPVLDVSLRQDIVSCAGRLVMISDREISIPLFSQVRIHRNNAFYDLLLRVCELIVENTRLDAKTGSYQFREFMGSEKAMARLFEQFIRNFYKREQEVFQVAQERIFWDMQPLPGSSAAFLPRMETDVSLESPGRKIIIDAKYYAETLISRYDGQEKFRAAHLYQLYAYLRNLEQNAGHPRNSSCEGILLYPQVTGALDEQYQLGKHRLRIKTINLGAPWREISQDLVSLIR